MNIDFANIEVLVAEPDQVNGCYIVVGTSYGDALVDGSKYKPVRASRLALDIVKNALAAGRSVKIPDETDGPEVRPVDLIITEDGNELETARRALLAEMNSAIGQNALGTAAVDMFGYMAAFSRLADHGVFVTDENREEKYFEVIDRAQQAEKPGELPEDASFAEEQAYLEKKRKYAFAQSALSALEQYLVSYDKVKCMRSFDSKVRDMLAEAKAASTVEEVDAVRARFKAMVDGMFMPGE